MRSRVEIVTDELKKCQYGAYRLLAAHLKENEPLIHAAMLDAFTRE